MQCPMRRNVQRAVSSGLQRVCSVDTVHCAVCSVYSVHCAVCSLHCAVCSHSVSNAIIDECSWHHCGDIEARVGRTES